MEFQLQIPCLKLTTECFIEYEPSNQKGNIRRMRIEDIHGFDMREKTKAFQLLRSMPEVEKSLDQRLVCTMGRTSGMGDELLHAS
jgi:hypothetical protein